MDLFGIGNNFHSLEEALFRLGLFREHFLSGIKGKCQESRYLSNVLELKVVKYLIMFMEIMSEKLGDAARTTFSAQNVSI